MKAIAMDDACSSAIVVAAAVLGAFLLVFTPEKVLGVGMLVFSRLWYVWIRGY